eukprot:Trichotokara_eunicae@DN9859_c0_g1_i1.p1
MIHSQCVVVVEPFGFQNAFCQMVQRSQPIFCQISLTNVPCSENKNKKSKKKAQEKKLVLNVLWCVVSFSVVKNSYQLGLCMDGYKPKHSNQKKKKKKKKILK